MKPGDRTATTPLLREAADRAGLSKDDLDALLAWLAELLVANEHAKLGQGGHTKSEIPLRRVFVDLPVTSPSDPQSRVLFLAQFNSAPALDLRLLLHFATEEPAEASAHERRMSRRLAMRASEYVFGSATLLIGGPGQGKSTLSQLACQLHRAALLRPYQRELQSRERDILSTFDGKGAPNSLKLTTTPLLPIHVSLPELAAWLARFGSPTSDVPRILSFITSLPSAKKGPLLPSTLLALAPHLPFLLVLDGFDEVGAAADREAIVAAARELIAVLAKREASAKVLATTRPQGYAGELDRIWIPLTHRQLVPLDSREAMEYAHKLVDAKISGADLREQTMQRLKDAAASPATARLLTTPLQVTIVTALVQQGRAPKERWRLFWSYFDYTYKREIERETYASSLLADHRSHIEAIHMRVALLLQVEAERAGGATARMSRDQLRTVVTAVLKEEGVDTVTTADQTWTHDDLVADIVKAAEERLVFLVEPEPDKFGFEIRSLQEFMAAWALSQGPDAQVKARMLQIAQAPMFRNTLLFMASKLYSEGSHLRDYLPDSLCVSVERDCKQLLGVDTSAGATLALEILEEGAVLNQPRFASSLLQRALALLAQPANDQHSRLARIGTEDWADVLRTEVERLTSRTDLLLEGAWVCLIESLNLGRPWAFSIADQQASRTEIASALISICSSAKIRLHEWVVKMLETAAIRGLPLADSIRALRHPQIATQASRTWATWIAQSIRRVDTDPKFGFALISAEPRVAFTPISEPNFEAPQSWTSLVAIARFNNSPSAHSLAEALSQIAILNDPADWSVLQSVSTWPLTASLNVCDSREDLLRLAQTIRDGDLGDIQDWRTMESRWKPLNMHLPSDAMFPWSVEEDLHTAPFAAVQRWALLRSTPRGTKLVTFAKVVSSFKSARSKAARARLAEVGLYMSHQARSKLSPDLLADLASMSPGAISLLVPRPQKLSIEAWRNLLDSAPRTHLQWPSCGLEDILHSCFESKAHPVLLHLLLTGLGVYLDDRRRMHGLDRTKILNDTRRLCRSYSVTDDDDDLRSYFLICRIWTADIQPGDTDTAIETVRRFAEREPSVWHWLLCALEFGDLSRKHKLMLLRGLSNVSHSPALSKKELLQLANRIAQSETSELDKGNHWSRLGLLAPTPLGALEGAITPPTEPIRIERIVVKDVRGIASLELSFAPPKTDGAGQWVVLLGPNGSGKTTLLRSIALACRNAADPSLWPDDAFALPWLRSGTERATIIVTTGGRVHETTIHAGPILRISQTPEHTYSRIFPLFGYGCRRGSALGGRSREVNTKDDGGPEVATLFSEARDIIHAETWLLLLNGEAGRNQNMRHVYDIVAEALTQLLKMRVDIWERRVWVTESSGRRILFEALSDGYLTTAGWFLDLIARWVEFLTRSGSPITPDFLERARGLVLIDEIDLHLHPRWQIETIRAVRKILPQMSFVVTTHNPLTLVGVEPTEIWILSDDGPNVSAKPGTDSPLLLTSGQLLRQYFGLTDIFPDGLGRKVQRYAFLSSYAERDAAEDAELRNLASELNREGLLPSWEIVERAEVSARPHRPRRRSTT